MPTGASYLFSLFRYATPVQDYIIAVSPDAAKLPSFQLCEARPGGQVLNDPTMTIQQAGVAEAMLVIKSGS